MPAYSPRRDLLSKIGRRVTLWRRARPAQLRFDEPLLSICFDDFPRTSAHAGAAIMEAHGARATYYASGSLLEQHGPCGENFNAEDARALDRRGHEIACHSYAHADLARQPVFETLQDLAQNRDALSALGVPAPQTLAYPYGETTFALKQALPPRFACARGVGRGLNAGGASLRRFRPAGWHAFNIARIENGWPIFNLDFGPDSLPAETGVIADRVSFTKGCYLGQEVVARMHSLGHPKQQLVALRVSSKEHEDPQWQPITGAAITSAAPLPPGGEAKPIGAVTSSTRSPMLGDDIICLAQVKWDQSQPGTKLHIHTTRGPLETSVEPTLTFWKRS